MTRLTTSLRERIPDRSPRPVEPVPAPKVANPDAIVFDEVLLARLRRLTLLSNRAVAQGLAGEHRSRRRGTSPEFADFKSYSQGDDFRRIDWNIYSRLGELFIRLSEVTTELTVHLLLDASGSMNWSGNATRPSKFTYARRVAGSMGYVGLWHFDRVVVTPFSDQLQQPFGPSHGRSHITPMLSFLSNLEATGTTSIGESMERYVRARRGAGVLVIFSDLLSGEPEEMRSALRLLRNRGWQTTVVQIIDPAELNPLEAMPLGPGNQPLTVELIDLETSARLRVTPDAGALESYNRAVQAWQAQIDEVCESEQISLIRLQTDWSFESVVLGMLNQGGVVG